MTSTLRVVLGEGGGKAKMRCYRTCGCGGLALASVLDVQFLFFLSKKIGFSEFSHDQTHANNILLTSNLHFDFAVRQ